MNHLLFTVIALLATLMCRADTVFPVNVAAPPSEVLEAALHAAYPRVQHWQLNLVSVVQQKRRPQLFAAVSDQLRIYRDGNLFRVLDADTKSESRYRVAGYQTVHVASMPLAKGQTFTTNATSSAERDVLSMTCDPLHDIEVAGGRRMRRSIKEAEVLCSNDIEAEPTIVRNDLVVIHCARGAVSTAISGVALNDGQLGEKIQVRPSRYYRALTATVIAEGEVNACG